LLLAHDTLYGWLAGWPASRGLYGGGVSCGGLIRRLGEWSKSLFIIPWSFLPLNHSTS